MFKDKKNDLVPSISRFIDDEWNNLVNWKNTNFSSSLPAVNISETKDSFEVEMAAPGMKKEDFQIDLENGMLNIKSEKESKSEKKDDKYVRKEFNYQSFQRSFSVDDKIIDQDKIKATYDNGLLHISIPKKEDAKMQHAKKINIQ